MAVTAKFLADFTSFQDAVAKADASLKSFDTEAHKVEASLNKMSDAFSGRKIIQDAELATKAVASIGGATNLTEKEQAQLNVQLTEALAKYKALGLQAPQAMHDLAAATQKVEPPMSLSAKAAGLLSSAFGQFTAAGLATTAITSLASGLGEFAKQGLQLPGLQRSFATLATGIGISSQELLGTMTEATHGLVSNLDLMQSANKAVLLGLPVTTESMGDLAAAATTLGRAMGQDATKSLDDLITALGRSSPMILDNLGLSVKVGEANEAYAAKLGKTAEALTDAEKKTAFYEAAMEAARKKTQELGEQTATLAEIAQIAWTKTGNFVTEFVAKENIALGKRLNLMAQMREDADLLGISFDRLAKAPKAPAAPPITAPRLFFPGQETLGKVQPSTRELEDVEARLNQVRTKLDETDKAAAKLVQTTRDQLFGKNITDQANLYARAIGEISNLSKVSSVEQAHINKALGEALDVYKRFGQTAPQAMRDLFIATARMPEVIDGGAQAMRDLQRVAELTVPVLYDMPKAVALTAETFTTLHATAAIPMFAIPKQAKVLKTDFGELSQALAQLAQVSGSTFGGMLSSLSSLVAAVNTAQKSLDLMRKGASEKGSLTGILDMASGITGIVTAAIAAGKAVAALFGLFDRNKGRDLVVDFAETFGGFDQLHEKLLMLGEDGEKLWIKLTQGVGRNNPAQAQAAIDEVTQALDDQAAKSDEAKSATEEQAQATIETATEAAKALDELGGKLDINKDQWKAWGAVVTAQLQALADAIRALPTPAAPGGGLPFSAGGGGRPTVTVQNHLYLDGADIAENSARRYQTS